MNGAVVHLRTGAGAISETVVANTVVVANEVTVETERVNPKSTEIILVAHRAILILANAVKACTKPISTVGVTTEMVNPNFTVYVTDLLVRAVHVVKTEVVPISVTDSNVAQGIVEEVVAINRMAVKQI